MAKKAQFETSAGDDPYESAPESSQTSPIDVQTPLKGKGPQPGLHQQRNEEERENERRTATQANAATQRKPQEEEPQEDGDRLYLYENEKDAFERLKRLNTKEFPVKLSGTESWQQWEMTFFRRLDGVGMGLFLGSDRLDFKYSTVYKIFDVAISDVIVDSVVHSLRPEIIGLSAAAAYDLLSGRYATLSISSCVSAYAAFATVKHTGGLREYFSSFMLQKGKFLAANGVLDRTVEMGALVMGLKPEYNTEAYRFLQLQTSIDIEAMKKALLRFGELQGKTTFTRTSVEQRNESRGRKGQQHPQQQHFHQQQPQAPQQQGPRPFSQQQQQQQPYQQRQNYGNPPVCNFCGKPGHLRAACWKLRPDLAPPLPHSRLEPDTHPRAHAAVTQTQKGWFLDSAASFHMATEPASGECPDQEGEIVRTATGEVIRSAYKKDINLSGVSLGSVRCFKRLDMNLASVSALTADGWQLYFYGKSAMAWKDSSIMISRVCGGVYPISGIAHGVQRTVLPQVTAPTWETVEKAISVRNYQQIVPKAMVTQPAQAFPSSSSPKSPSPPPPTPQHAMIPPNIGKPAPIEIRKSKRTRKPTEKAAAAAAEPAPIANVRRWVVEEDILHRRMGHLNRDYVRQLNRVAAKPTSIRYSKKSFCEICKLAKQTRASHKEPVTRATRVGQRIHADLCGGGYTLASKQLQEETDFATWPVSEGGAKLFIVLTDDFSRYRKVVPLKSKDGAATAIQNFIQAIEAKGQRTESFRCDGGGEFVS